MNEDDVRNHLNRQTGSALQIGKRPVKVVRRPAKRQPQPPPQEEAYKDFSATHLLCPRCRQAMPVRERILLFLPDGDLYEYSCTTCGTAVGTRKAGR